MIRDFSSMRALRLTEDLYKSPENALSVSDLQAAYRDAARTIDS